MSDPPAFDDAQIKYLDENYGGASSQNVHWMIFNGVLVFLMQCGFAMLCAGSVRAKNAQNILLKNLVDTCVGAMGFWATGYALHNALLARSTTWTRCPTTRRATSLMRRRRGRASEASPWGSAGCVAKR